MNALVAALLIVGGIVYLAWPIPTKRKAGWQPSREWLDELRDFDNVDMRDL